MKADFKAGTKKCSRCKKTLALDQFTKEATSDGLRQWCRKCTRKQTKLYYQQHRKGLLQWAAEYRKDHKEERRVWWTNYNRGTGFEIWLTKQYNIDLSQYNRMLRNQNYRCAGCRTKFKSKRGGDIRVDHSHVTGKVRGLLCQPCNLVLGFARDNPRSLRRLATYLSRT